MPMPSTRSTSQPGGLSRRVDACEPEPAEHECLDDGDDDPEGDENGADPEKERRTSYVHPTRGREDLTPGSTSREPKRRDRAPGGACHEEDYERDQRTEDEER